MTSLVVAKSLPPPQTTGDMSLENGARIGKGTAPLDDLHVCVARCAARQREALSSMFT